MDVNASRGCYLHSLFQAKNTFFSHDFGLQNELEGSNDIMYESIVFAFLGGPPKKNQVF